MANEQPDKLDPVVKLVRSNGVPLKVAAIAHRATGGHIPIGRIDIEPQFDDPFEADLRPEYDADAQAIFEVLHDSLPSGTYYRLAELFADALERDRQQQQKLRQRLGG